MPLYYPPPITDHGGLSGLGDDDHTQYALLAGRAGGQTLNGDTASGGSLMLVSTAHATKGKILFGTSAYDEVGNRLGIATISPSYDLSLGAGADRTIRVENAAAGNGNDLTVQAGTSPAGLGTGGALNLVGGAATINLGGAVNVDGGDGATGDGAVRIATSRGDLNLSRSGGRIGFYGVGATAQPAGTTDVLASLVTLGLRAASSNPPLNLGTGALTSGKVNADNLQLDGNTLLSTNTNGNILVIPDGTGEVRFGSTVNYCAIQADGDLVFAGAAQFRVPTGTAAFVSDSFPLAGLFFASTGGGCYEFRDTAGVRSSGLFIDQAAFFQFGVEYPATTPAQITANQNDYAGMAQSGYARISSDAARDITGVAAPPAPADGRLRIVTNVGAFSITFKHQDAGSVAANRIVGIGGADTVLVSAGKLGMLYDGTISRWWILWNTA